MGCVHVEPCFSVCVYVFVCIFFLSLTMKYLTLSILFQFIEGEGIPAGGYRIRYTYTLTPIIKLSYFLFNRYKTTTALPWLLISTFVPSLVHSITSRASLSRLVTLPRLFPSYISVYLPLSPQRPPFKRTIAVRTQRRTITTSSPSRASYSSLSSPSAPLIIIRANRVLVSRPTTESYVPLEHWNNTRATIAATC